VGSPTFDDFVPFGRWTQARVKQYAQNQLVCGANVDLNVVCSEVTSSKTQNTEKKLLMKQA
jgi:hypothetical protein